MTDSKLLNEDRSSPTKGAFGPASCFVAGRDAPKGSIGWHVDCSDNPMDLRPAVDIIVRAIEETLPRVPSGSPLVVLVGEDHRMPTHKLLLPFLTMQLAQLGHHFSAAFEHPHDICVRVADNLNIGVPLKLRTAPGYWYETDGKAALSSYLGLCLSPLAPLSHLNGLRTLYHLVNNSGGRVRAVFNDAVENNGGMLDLGDRLTKAAVNVYAHVRGKDLSAIKLDTTESGGMACRNLAITYIALRHLSTWGAPILLQQTGVDHVFGNVCDREEFQDSLMKFFTREDARVVPVFPTSREDHYGLNIAPLEAREAFAQAVVIDGLAEDQFGRELWEGGWD